MPAHPLVDAQVEFDDVVMIEDGVDERERGRNAGGGDGRRGSDARPRRAGVLARIRRAGGPLSDQIAEEHDGRGRTNRNRRRQCSGGGGGMIHDPARGGPRVGMKH